MWTRVGRPLADSNSLRICGIIEVMRLAVDKFEVLTDKKLEKPLRVVLVSDVHAGNLPLMSGKINFNSTLKGIKKMRKIDFFAFCGDFLNNAQSWRGTPAEKHFVEFTQELAKIAPVILVRGNHDIFEGDERTEENYQKLEKLENIILLDNKQMKLLGIKITGFTPRHEVYDLGKHGEMAQKISVQDFKKEHFWFDEEDFNLILTHSPYNITNKTMLRDYPEIFEKGDVILSGHLHNGLMPSGNFEFITRYFNKLKPKNKLQKFWARNIDTGIWFGMKTGFVISHCRGAKLAGEGKIGYPILPSSKRFVKIDLTKEKNKLVQIIGKSISKYFFLPILQGRPSVVELKISPKVKN